MMNCIETQSKIDSYLDGDLSNNEKKLIDSHFSRCICCQQLFDDIEQLRKDLSLMPIVGPSAGFEERVLAEVRKQHAVQGGNKFTIGFVSAMAVSLMIWIVSSVFSTGFNSQQPQLINVAMNEVHTVRLMLDAPSDIAQVTLSLGLPENIRLKGYESKQQLVWQTRLNKGANILALPVTGIANGQGDLVAYVRYGETTKQFRIKFKTMSDNDGALNYPFYKLNSV